ncbi:MAG: hemerythrin domain-containing protein [Candidatus Omnitrophota bacterium]|nr:MAG: hemerythrin domain-containing protein [Candidatus Omnitrophota bacterium]
MEEERKSVEKETLDRAKQDHSHIFEEMELLRVALPYLDSSEEASNNVRKTVDFFERNIVPHFIYEEENLFAVALTIGELNIKLITRELQQEHISILSKLDQLKDIIFKYGFILRDERVKDEFVGLSREIIGLFLQHARNEDEKFYPCLSQMSVKTDVEFKE